MFSNFDIAMNELDLALFSFAHEPISIKEIYKNIHLNIAKKTIYTSICRLEKQGFITKKQQGKNILIQQSIQPASTYLHTLLENQRHRQKKHWIG